MKEIEMNEQANQNTNAASGTVGLIAALAYIDNVGFHGIATNLGGPTPKIDRTWAGLVRNARTAVSSVHWPEDVQDLADRFAAAAAQLATAIDQRDTTAAADPAKEIHVAYHALSDAAWNHLAKSAGTYPGGTEHHHNRSGHAH